MTLSNVPLPSTSIDVSAEDTLSAKWEAFFSEALDNRNLSIKDVETAKFVFFSGAAAAVELTAEAQTLRNNLESELSNFLGASEEEEAWFSVKLDQEDSNAQADSQQGQHSNP